MRRELKHGGAPTLLEFHGNAQVMQWMGMDASKYLEATHHTVSRFLAGHLSPVPSKRWGLERKSDGQLLGTGGVSNLSKEWKKCTLGYELGIEAQRQGYVHEALNAIIP